MCDLPLFPNQRLLVVEDEKIVTGFTKKFGCYSDFNFVSLWGYNINDDVKISLLNENLVVQFKDYLVDGHFFSFLGNTDASSTIKTLLENSHSKGMFSELKLVPGENISIAELVQDQFYVSEDRDNYDYLLSVKELAELRGSHFERQRKEIHRLLRNTNISVKKIDLTQTVNQVEIISLFDKWVKKKIKTEEESFNERSALLRTIKLSGILPIYVLGVFNSSELVGFLLADTLDENMAESHFLKYDPDYSGIKHLLHHELAKFLSQQKYQHINIEQDFGIEGLRLAKNACRPVGYLKKYKISFSSDS